MNKIHLFFILTFFFSISFSQETYEMNCGTFDEFLTEQNVKITSIDYGIYKEEVIEIMGESILLKIPESGDIKELNQLFKQPEFMNAYSSNPKKLIDILWYFSTPRDQNGVISRRECTPIIIENNVVVGKGWTFFMKYRKKNRLY